VPELPEVETIRRELEAGLVGATVLSVWTSGQALRLGRPVDVEALARASVGRRVQGARRIGKYLLIDSDGEDVWVVHLGMSGRLGLVAKDVPRPKHTHIVWELDGERELRFSDARRFGMVRATRRGKERELGELAGLGIDPLSADLTTLRLYESLSVTRREIKAFLLDQSRVSGLGNIYVCEALFAARVHPRKRTDRIRLPVAESLREAIVCVLTRALSHRGTTLRDYQGVSGERGENQFHLSAYGREGEECPRQDGRIRRIVQQARSTFFCPGCQRR
jgi:formamidopyrimidine-DNA glycosylase